MYHPIVALVFSPFLLTPSSAFYTWSYPPQTLAALQSILKDPGLSTCLNPDSIQSLLVAPSGGKPDAQAYTTALNTWLPGFCTRPACDNSTLAAMARKTVPARAADLDTKVPDENQLNLGTELLQVAYPVHRELVCLRTGNEFCLAPTVVSEMAQSGAAPDTPWPLIPLPISLVPGPSDELYTPDSFKCSDCHKAVITILSPELTNPDLVVERYGSVEEFDKAKAAIEGECGAGFMDGVIPESIMLASDSKSGNTTTSTQASTPSASASAPSSPAQRVSSTFTQAQGLSIIILSAFVVIPAWARF